MRDGSLDRGFHTDAVARFRPYRDLEPRVLLAQPDGKLVVVGWSNHENFSQHPVVSDFRFTLARFRADGTIDKSFGDRGLVRTRFPGQDSYAKAYAAALLRDGKVLVAGSAGSQRLADKLDFALARYTSHGKLDRRFGKNGFVRVALSKHADDEAQAVAVARSGAILAGGYALTGAGSGTTINAALARFTPAGRLDRTFDRDGKLLFREGRGAFPGISALVLQSNGKLVAGDCVEVLRFRRAFVGG